MAGPRRPRATSTAAALGPARTELRRLLLKGQERIHFKKERDSRRRAIISTMITIGAAVTIYDASAGPRTELQRRKDCLAAMVEDAAVMGAHRLVLEQDDSTAKHDKQVLREHVHKMGCAETLRYELLRARSECQLAIPDAAAWCWAKGGDWRRRVEPMVTAVRKV